MISQQAAPAPSTTAPKLQVALLGPPEVVWQGRSLPIPRRQARALLYRLAAASGPVPRDQLAFLFWPDAPQAAARRNLTVLLAQIRRLLPRPELLTTHGDTVGLHAAALTVDTASFAALAPLALQANRLGQLAEATQLYRGPFLDGFGLPDAPEFEAWAIQERETWERRYLDALGALATAYTGAGDYAAAIAAAQRSLATDPLAEDVHRSLIELYALVGDRAAAMRQFEQCAAILARELGVEPLPETRALYDAVRSGQAPLQSRHVETSTLPGPKHLSPTAVAGPRIADPPTGSFVPAAPPAPLGSLFGRDDEIIALCGQLADPALRLLTLTGPGGSGKTRLALEVLRRVAPRVTGTVVFVPLAPLRDAALLLDTIAQACGIQSAGASSALAALRAGLAERATLLVLDNFEHLMPAAPMLADLLAALPDLRILVTSRSRLQLSGEHVVPVQPLPLPDLTQLPRLEALAAQPAVALLLARSQALNPSLALTPDNAADLAAICVQLDGLPLALELAAARLNILSPQALLRRLEHRLGILRHGARDLPERQRTLRATIEWSYRLLDHSEQRLFERLAVFAGGWTLAVAEALCGEDGAADDLLEGMQALLDASLVVVQDGTGDDPRFGMLETLREYGLERLEEHGEAQAVRRKHAGIFCEVVALQAPWRVGGGAESALSRLDRDYNNLRAALGWSIEAGEHIAAGRIAAGLVEYWDRRGLIAEGHAWIAQVLAVAQEIPQPWRSDLQAQAAFLAYRAGALDQTAHLSQVVLSAADASIVARASAINTIGLAAQEAGDFVAARRAFDDTLALAEAHSLDRDVAGVRFNLGVLAMLEGQLAASEAHFEFFFAYAERMSSVREKGAGLMVLGFVALRRGDPQLATARLRAGLELLHSMHELTFLLYGLLACCAIMAIQQQPLRSAALFGAATAHAHRRGLTFAPQLLRMAQQQMAEAQRQSEPEAFEQAAAEGRAWPLEDAVGHALAWLGSAKPFGDGRAP